ncbi:MAG: dephospho-CoA kinase [Candidatus Brocadiae bacterium]|nr:dephospho-CoA kinase [Candidatus Brocadiia bacterium]
MSSPEGQPPVIGLLGGIAAGKTAVAAMLERLGARIVSADVIAHEVLADPQTRGRITARWGEQVVGPSGAIEHGALAERIFGDAEELAALEAITHPPILARMREQIHAACESGNVAAVVVDAPLLLEAELDAECDALIFVDCPRDERLKRAAAERGWEADELDRREAHQEPLDVKRDRAEYVVSTDCSPDTTFQQVKELWQEALGL